MSSSNRYKTSKTGL